MGHTSAAAKQALLDAVASDIRSGLDCPLKHAAANLVFGKGNPDAPILFIGEAPGANEDRLGIPFVGSAGKKLDAMLQSIGLALDQCYVANILKYRPPGNRPPRPDEMKRHTPYLVRQINIIKPKVIVTLGNFSTKFVLAGLDVDKMTAIPGISQLHGKVQTVHIGEDRCTVIPLYHPAACIYDPRLRETMMQDFKIISRHLEGN